MKYVINVTSRRNNDAHCHVSALYLAHCSLELTYSLLTRIRSFWHLGNRL